MYPIAGKWENDFDTSEIASPSPEEPSADQAASHIKMRKAIQELIVKPVTLQSRQLPTITLRPSVYQAQSQEQQAAFENRNRFPTCTPRSKKAC